jgi:heme exporter protein A
MEPAPDHGPGAAVETVAVEKLVKRYGRQRALAGVSLTLRAGSLCAILGENGAGKSTLLGILSTLVKPTSGEVAFQAGGQRQPPDSRLRRQIGVLAHDSFLYAGLTAYENLQFYGRLFGVEGAEARAAALLDEVGLEEAARDRPAGGYSRGMQQRLALARALLHDPQVLLLDEPFTGLDRTGAEALSRTLAKARADGRVVLVVTHDLESIGGVTDHVVVLRRGRVVFEERRTPPEAFSHAELKELYHHHSD